jgi:hypothetical protein
LAKVFQELTVALRGPPVGGHPRVTDQVIRNPHARIVVSPRHQQKDTVMVIGITHLQPIVALVAGIAILIIPRLLNFIVAAYLIVVGVIGLGLIK